MCCTVCITFISYFDKIKSSAKIQTESSGNEILTSRPNGLSKSRTVAPLLKQSLIVKVCVREIESDREKNTCVCFREYVCAIVCVRMGNDQFKQRFTQRGETVPNLGSVTDWVNMKIWAAEKKKYPVNIFSSNWKKKICSCGIFWTYAFFSPGFSTFITYFSHR